jgi:hypothetical protein
LADRPPERAALSANIRANERNFEWLCGRRFLQWSTFSGGLGKEGFDNLVHLGALTFRTLDFLCLVLLDRQNFGNFFATLAAKIFVDWHNI